MTKSIVQGRPAAKYARAGGRSRQGFIPGVTAKASGKGVGYSVAEHVVAVEPGLEPVREELRQRGFRTVELGPEPGRADAVVVRGTDENLLNRHDVLTGAPVIEATGLTARQVADEVERRLRR